MSRQIDKKATRQIRINSNLHRILKVKSARLEITIKKFAEKILTDELGINLETKKRIVNKDDEPKP